MTELAGPLGVQVIMGIITMLLSALSFIMVRLLNKIDKMTDEISSLNKTMSKIERDLSGDIGVLKEKHTALQHAFDRMQLLWDRIRVIEHNLTEIQSGKCPAKKDCEK